MNTGDVQWGRVSVIQDRDVHGPGRPRAGPQCQRAGPGLKMRPVCVMRLTLYEFVLAILSYMVSKLVRF